METIQRNRSSLKTRIKRKSKLRSRVGTASSSKNIEPLHHVRAFSLQEIKAAPITSGMRKALFDIYEIVSKHPFYEKREWHKDSSIVEFIDHLAKHLSTISKIESDKVEFVTIYPENEFDDPMVGWVHECLDTKHCHTLIECDFLEKLKRSNASAYNLSLSLLSFCNHQLGIPLWNDCDEERSIEFIEEGFEDAALEDKKFDQMVIAEFRNKAAPMANRIMTNHVSTDQFIQAVDAYRPRAMAFKRLKQLMLDAIVLFDIGFHYDSHSYFPLYNHEFYDEGELWPSSTTRFVWSLSDRIGEDLYQYVNDHTAQLGNVPMIEFFPFDESIYRSDFKIETGIINSFIKWMIQADEVFRKINKHYSK